MDSVCGSQFFSLGETNAYAIIKASWTLLYNIGAMLETKSFSHWL